MRGKGMWSVMKAAFWQFTVGSRAVRINSRRLLDQLLTPGCNTPSGWMCQISHNHSRHQYSALLSWDNALKVEWNASVWRSSERCCNANCSQTSSIFSRAPIGGQGSRGVIGTFSAATNITGTATACRENSYILFQQYYLLFYISNSKGHWKKEQSDTFNFASKHGLISCSLCISVVPQKWLDLFLMISGFL